MNVTESRLSVCLKLKYEALVTCSLRNRFIFMWFSFLLLDFRVNCYSTICYFRRWAICYLNLLLVCSNCFRSPTCNYTRVFTWFIGVACCFIAVCSAGSRQIYKVLPEVYNMQNLLAKYQQKWSKTCSRFFLCISFQKRWGNCSSLSCAGLRGYCWCSSSCLSENSCWCSINYLTVYECLLLSSIFLWETWFVIYLCIAVYWGSIITVCEKV
jgi:hypothetical protein